MATWVSVCEAQMGTLEAIVRRLVERACAKPTGPDTTASESVREMQRRAEAMTISLAAAAAVLGTK